MNNHKRRKKNNIQWSDKLIKEYEIESQCEETEIIHYSLKESKDKWPHIPQNNDIHIIDSKCNFINRE